MFRWAAIISFGVIFAGLLLHHLLFPCGYKPRFSPGSLIRKKVHLFILLFPEQKLSLPGKIRKFIFLLGLLSFVVLLLTGFTPLMLGSRLAGYWLIIHATFAPVFIGCTALLALLGAGQYRFNKEDLETVGLGCTSSKIDGCRLTDIGIGAKAGFWLLLILSLPVTLTMVLSMFPLFGTHYQELFYHLHRWCGLVFAWIAIVELYILIRMGILEDTKKKSHQF
ncbi:MAG: hypothetical protein FJ263_06895 [Planctomycetes bacterium]|nr:hypothetical protein [Planctomycetota bacterium]